MPKIAHLPAIIINGRWDAICLPEMAYAVYQNWPQSQLWMIPDAGHASSESSLAGALVTATDLFAEEITQTDLYRK